MTDPRPPARRVLALLPALLLVLLAAAGGWWLGAARPVPPDELVRAAAWQGTEELLAHPALDASEEASALRADLERQLAALGPAPGDRAGAAARDARPAPADPGGPGAAAGPGGPRAAGTPGGRGDLAAALSASAADLARDALGTQDPALARVLGASAASRAVTAGRLDEASGAAPWCAPGAEPASDGPASSGALLWSALDRAGYALEALAARAEPAPGGGPGAPLLRQAHEDVEELLETPAARGVLASDPGLRAGAYVLPGAAAEEPGRAAGAAARGVQEAAAHALASGAPGARCWALLALERATGFRAALDGEVAALPGVPADGAAPR